MKQNMLAAFGLVAAAYAAPQGVTQPISPSGGAPSGCSPSFSGDFEISVVETSSKRGLFEKRACGSGPGALVLSLNNGILMDAQGSTGYIAANRQFQFDDPPQTGAIFTAGFSACSDNTLALGSSKTFYRCLSGDFYNLYDKDWAPQCQAISIELVPCGGAAPPPPAGGSGKVVGSTTITTAQVTALSDGQPQVVPTTIVVPVTQITDGQVQAPTGVVTVINDGQPQAPPPVSVISDGQPQAPTGVVSVISDGQPQAPTGVVSVISDGQPQAPTGVVSVISDGQPQAPTGVVSVISDGQPQAPTGVVSVISDGQPQAPTGVVSVISDGQPQAPTGVVSVISDGQPQAPTGVVSVISDGQPQAPTGTGVPPPPPPPPPANTSIVVVPTPVPSSLPGSLGNKVIPGTTAALVVGIMAAILYL